LARVGILGGTFDPPHIGHIAIARAALIELRLTKILFIPARIPPHKTTKTAASPQDRLNMLYLALDDEAAFEISEIELGREGPSFTADTLEELKKHRPYDQLYLIIGTDNVAEIETWRDPEKIFELATVAAANRPNYTPAGQFAQAIVYFTMPATDLSSTVIRERLRSGLAVADMLSPDVENYIRENGLYLNHA
jgi:nicotinate-nucleotide adenylyltransferase